MNNLEDYSQSNALKELADMTLVTDQEEKQRRDDLVRRLAEDNMNYADYYQRQAMRTCSIKDNNRDKLNHGVLGLASEAGEVAGLFQKRYQGHSIDIEHLIKECGDCLWMIAEILDAVGIPMSVCMDSNIEKLRARYPEGFDPERSLHRSDGDI